MKPTEIEKLNQLISRTDLTGNEKVAWLTDFIDKRELQSLQSCVSSCSCNDLIVIDYKIKKCIDCGKTFHFE